MIWNFKPTKYYVEMCLIIYLVASNKGKSRHYLFIGKVLSNTDWQINHSNQYICIWNASNVNNVVQPKLIIY